MCLQSWDCCWSGHLVALSPCSFCVVMELGDDVCVCVGMSRITIKCPNFYVLTTLSHSHTLTPPYCRAQLLTVLDNGGEGMCTHLKHVEKTQQSCVDKRMPLSSDNQFILPLAVVNSHGSCF